MSVSVIGCPSRSNSGKGPYLLDGVCPAGAAETALDITLKHLNLAPCQVAGGLSLEVAKAGHALGVDKANKPLKRHDDVCVFVCVCFGDTNGAVGSKMSRWGMNGQWPVMGNDNEKQCSQGPHISGRIQLRLTQVDVPVLDRPGSASPEASTYISDPTFGRTAHAARADCSPPPSPVPNPPATPQLQATRCGNAALANADTTGCSSMQQGGARQPWDQHARDHVQDADRLVFARK